MTPMLRKILLSLALIFALAFPFQAFALPLPESNLNNLGMELLGMQPDACGPDTLGAVFEFSRKGERYKAVVLLPIGSPGQSGAFVIFSLAEGDHTPVWIGVADEDGNFTVTQETTYTPFMDMITRPGGICTIFGYNV